MVKTTSILVLLIFVLSACAGSQPTITPTVLPPTSTQTATIAPTATETPIPTATNTPTPEPTAVAETIDLKIAYEEKVSVKYMGVQINASLITDESLDPLIKKVTVGEKAYAEFVARTIYKVWLKKGGPDGTGPKAETTFAQFMALWSTAQKSGLEADWRQVQVENIWANDIPTPGYEQHPYTIWFMHEGQTPEDVKGISNLSIALVRVSNKKNITVFENNPYGQGIGTNLDGGNLYIYNGFVNGDNGNEGVASGIAYTASWMISNTGRSVSGYGAEDKTLTNLLVKGGLAFYH